MSISSENWTQFRLNNNDVANNGIVLMCKLMKTMQMYSVLPKISMQFIIHWF